MRAEPGWKFVRWRLESAAWIVFIFPRTRPRRIGHSHGRPPLRSQLALARRLGCPVVVHSRGAFSACVEMIEASGVDWSRVVFHCFSEGPDEIRELNRRGARGSFTGI